LVNQVKDSSVISKKWLKFLKRKNVMRNRNPKAAKTIFAQAFDRQLSSLERILETIKKIQKN